MTYAQNLGLLKNNSLPSLVQEELETMLRNGMFSPGEALREVTLANQLGVSRGPIREAFRSLEEKGYNYTNQISGYLVTGDPSYIPRYNNARNLIKSIERDLIIEELLKSYLESNE